MKKQKKQSLSKLPVFHIVIPSFNQGGFIAETLDSTLVQGGSGFEVRVYVMDGGSTDGTDGVLKKYGKRIFWVSEKDRGQTDAINKGLRFVLKDADLENDIFAYLNSDDYYLDGAFEVAAREFANNPDKSWLVGDCRIVEEKGNEIQPKVRGYKNFWRSFLSKNLLLILNPIAQPAVFMKLKAVKAAGEFDQNLRYTMDYEYWLRMWEMFGAPINIDKELSAFRIHGSSKGSTSFESQFAEQLAVAKKYSQNQALLALQVLHNKLITTVYKLIK
jgi:glycosyltransferase involved in cell wall biosynthesis